MKIQELAFLLRARKGEEDDRSKRRPSGSSGARIRPCGARLSDLARTVLNHPYGSFSRSTDLPVFRLPVPKLRGTRTVQPKPVPWRSPSFLTGRCRATA